MQDASFSSRFSDAAAAAIQAFATAERAGQKPLDCYKAAVTAFRTFAPEACPRFCAQAAVQAVLRRRYQLLFWTAGEA